MSHFIKKCSCGVIIAQCKCMDKNKSVEIVKNGCDKCGESLYQKPKEEITKGTECEVCSPGKDKVIPVDNVLNPHCADCGRKISLIGDCFKTLYKPTECEDGYRVCYTSPELRKTVCSEKIVFKPKKIDKMKAITDDSSIMKNRYKINEIIDHLNKVSKVRE